MNELPPMIDVNDAVALLINHTNVVVHDDLFKALEHAFDDISGDFDQSNDNNSTTTNQMLSARQQVRYERLELANRLKDAINAEIKYLRKGNPSLLELSTSSQGSKKLLTTSVLNWAREHLGIDVVSWHPPEAFRKSDARKHTTNLLEILDHLISTFYEEGGEQYRPGVRVNSESVKSWLESTYSCTSTKIREVLFTISDPNNTSCK
jgi:hypothetical protein